jgi:hypothetical protein
MASCKKKANVGSAAMVNGARTVSPDFPEFPRGKSLKVPVPYAGEWGVLAEHQTDLFR